MVFQIEDALYTVGWNNQKKNLYKFNITGGYWKVDEDFTIWKEILLKDVGFSSSEIPSIKPMKGTGCDTCDGSGYKGRQGIYEFLEITNKMGQGIIEGLRAHELLEVAKKDGFTTMEELGRAYLKDGVLSYEEFLRVISISH